MTVQGLKGIILLAGLMLGAAAGAAETDALAQARRLADAGHADRAIARLARAINRDLNSPGRAGVVDLRKHRLYQDLYLKFGRADELRRRYRKLQRRRLQDPQVRYLLTRLIPRDEDRRRELEGLLVLDEKLFWAHLDLAEILAGGGELEGSLRHAQAAAKLIPTDPDPRNVVGHLQLQLGRTAEARRSFEAVLRLKPDHAEALYNLALVALAAREPAEAERRLRDAVRARPDFAEALNNLGLLLSHGGKREEAIAWFRRATLGRPGYGAAHNNLAVALYRTGDLWAAKTHIEKAKAAGFTPNPGFEKALERALRRQKGWGKRSAEAGASSTENPTGASQPDRPAGKAPPAGGESPF